MIDFALTWIPLYFKGALVTLGLSLMALLGALVIGLFVALGRLSARRWVRALSLVYATVFRGVPPLVLLYIVYFGLPAWAAEVDSPWLTALLSPLDNRLFAATAAFAVNSGAYVSEVIRASIGSINPGQLEAGRSLGMGYATAMRFIVLPQAFRVAFPPLCNEFIITLKGTSLASVIGVTELMRYAQMTASSTFLNLDAYVLAAVFYLAMVVLLQVFASQVERYLGRSVGARRS